MTDRKMALFLRNLMFIPSVCHSSHTIKHVVKSMSFSNCKRKNQQEHTGRQVRNKDQK